MKFSRGCLVALLILALSNLTSILYIISLRNQISYGIQAAASSSQDKKQLEEYRILIDDYKNSLGELTLKYDIKNEENNDLKKTITEMQMSYNKWNLFEKRYEESSRCGSEVFLHITEGIKPVLMRVTAYTEYECDKDPDHPYFGITASGNHVVEWFTVAGGKELPFGTRVYIPYFREYENNGIFVVEDRGSAINENCLDIYIKDQSTVDNFGVKFLDVYILNFP